MPTNPLASFQEPLRLEAVRSLVRAILTKLSALLSASRRSWRRSLQLRMVTYTLVASSLLITIFGVVVATRIQSGLVEARLKSAQAQLASGQSYAVKQLDAYTRPDDSDLGRSVQGVLDNLTQTPGFDRDGAAVLVPAAPSIPFEVTASGVRLDDTDQVITPAIRALVADGHQAHQFVTTHLGTGGPEPALVVGTPVNVNVGTFELYYVLPMSAEVASANLITRTVVITGIALALLLAIMAALITRVVVNPVRDAARTAQRLSAGLLDQRMEVKGEDDLARLAASFNQMAINLQRQIVRLEEMSRLQRRFTSDVSHELRTPLTTVRMAADLMYSSRDELDPLMARSAELLHAELDRFEELLTDLLEISRFDAGFAVLDAEPTDLVTIVDRVVDRLSPLARHAGTSLQINTPGGVAIAEVDPRRVERVLRNLIGNAIEHSEGQPVVITLGVDDSAIAMTVRDYGIGLKPGEEKLVFNRFWRADPSRARQTGGTGLGLSISLEDARLHGGWLEAWGSPGKGSQFRLVVPLRAGGRLNSSPLALTPTDDGPPRPEPTKTEAAHA